MNQHEEHWALEHMLSNVKQQRETGPMRHQLYQVLEERGKKLPDLKFQWMFYAGMGDVDFADLRDEKEEFAARKLIEQGRFVPIAPEDFHGVYQIQRIKHFDDVSWGKLEDGSFVIYELSHNEMYPDIPDTVIMPDKRHDAAIAELKSRMGYPLSIGKAWEDDPIELKNGMVITPILTNLDTIHLRMRQKGILPVKRSPELAPSPQ